MEQSVVVDLPKKPRRAPSYPWGRSGDRKLLLQEAYDRFGEAVAAEFGRVDGYHDFCVEFVHSRFPDLSGKMFDVRVSGAKSQLGYVRTTALGELKEKHVKDAKAEWAEIVAKGTDKAQAEKRTAAILDGGRLGVAMGIVNGAFATLATSNERQHLLDIINRTWAK